MTIPSTLSLSGNTPIGAPSTWHIIDWNQRRVVLIAMADHLNRGVRLLSSKLGIELEMKCVMLHFMYNAISITMYAQESRFIEKDPTVTTPNGEFYEATCNISL